MHTMPIFLLLISVLLPGFSSAQQDPNLAMPQAPAAASAQPSAEAPAANETASPATSAPVSAPVTGSFSSGLEAFKKGDFAESRKQFAALLNSNPQDPVLLYNLGLVEMTDKHPGRALAYWRKALYLSPGYSPVLAGMAQLKKSKLLPPDAQVSPMAWLYWRVPLTILLALSLALFVATGVLWVRVASRAKSGQPGPVMGLSVSAVLLVVFLGLSAHDYQLYHYETKATIMEATAPAFSSPSIEAPSLFEFREGDEVTIRRTQEDWIQVQKSATAVGWIKKNQLLIHSGT
jgi:tetratricopeptide (TPR) repeat protein